MAADNIEICNLALARVGAARITSLTANTKEAQACSRYYARTVRNLLSMHDWPFAQRVRPLPVNGSNILLLADDYTSDGLAEDPTITYSSGVSLGAGIYGNFIKVEKTAHVKIVHDRAMHLAGRVSIQGYVVVTTNVDYNIWSIYKDARNYLTVTAPLKPATTDHYVHAAMVVDGVTVASITDATGVLGQGHFKFIQLVLDRGTMSLYVGGTLVGTDTIDESVDLPYGDCYLGGNPTTYSSNTLNYVRHEQFQIIHGDAVEIGMAEPTEEPDEPEAEELINGWLDRYVLPFEAVRLVGLESESDPGHMLPESAYEVQGRFIYSDVADAYLRYCRLTVPVVDFPIPFEDALVYRLAAELAMNLTGNPAVEQAMMARFQYAFATARATNGEPHIIPERSQLLDVRN